MRKLNYETIEFELREDGIGILTLNRPKRMNAISVQFVEDVNSLFDDLMTNLDCRVVIMRGTLEGKAFCAGLDIKEAPLLGSKRVPEAYKKFKHIDVPELVKRTLYWQNRMAQIVVKMRKTSQPIIALIHGPATGGGFTFAMAADVRLVSEAGRFSIGAINIGMSGGDLGGAYFLPRLIGMSRAAELMYTGRYLGAEEAEKIGFVLKVVEEDKLLDSALELAGEMLTKSPLGLRMTKEAINMTLDTPSLETMINLDNRAQTLCTTSKDFTASMQAFIEKKEPKFPLR